MANFMLCVFLPNKKVTKKSCCLYVNIRQTYTVNFKTKTIISTKECPFVMIKSEEIL